MRLFVSLLILTLATTAHGETRSFVFEDLAWTDAALNPAFVDLDFDLGGAPEDVTGVTLTVEGRTTWGTSLFCQGPDCAYVPCRDVLVVHLGGSYNGRNYALLTGPGDTYTLDVPIAWYQCDPMCSYTPCEPQAAPAEAWAGLADGTGTLRLELLGELCRKCDADYGIDRVTVTVEFGQLVPAEAHSWGALKARYR